MFMCGGEASVEVRGNVLCVRFARSINVWEGDVLRFYPGVKGVLNGLGGAWLESSF